MKIVTVVDRNKKEKERKKVMEKIVGEGKGFERIRRVTGYLAGDVSRFNNGKRAEERDRVKHSGYKDICKKIEKEAA